MFLMHPEIPPWEDLGDCPHVTQGQMGGQCIPTLLFQPLPDAEPNNFTQPLLMGFLNTIFLKTLSCVKGPGARGECLAAVYQPK